MSEQPVTAHVEAGAVILSFDRLGLIHRHELTPTEAAQLHADLSVALRGIRAREKELVK